MKAELVNKKTGEVIENVSAKKENGQWIIGGENARESIKLGYQIFIIFNNKLYYLKGNRLIFQDNYITGRK